jgi:hypothetical protein
MRKQVPISQAENLQTQDSSVDYVQEVSPIEFGTWKNHSIQLNKKVEHLATFD